MRASAAVLLAVLAGAAIAAPPGGGGWRLRRGELVRTGLEVAAWRVLDLDRDGRTEVLLVGHDGRVLTWRADGGAFPPEPVGDLRLPDPSRTLLALAPTGGEESPLELVAASPRGVHAFALGARGVFAPEPLVLAARARHGLRPGRPVFAGIVQDVNRDGRPDLVLPAGRVLELWLTGEGGWGTAELRRVARIPVDVAHWASTDAGALSDVLVESFRIPRLETEDVNGDGRPDLVVHEDGDRAFHLQREDGGFPLEPDVTLDRSLFRDTTPEAEVRPGRTLVAGDDAQVQSSDLDGDGIPDFLIAHRRKVWVFHGGAQGPQFTHPSSILKTAQDVTGLALLHLNDGDEHPDLVIYRVEVPSVAALIVGMFRSWDVEIRVVGYANLGGRRFATGPSREGRIVLRLPPLLEVLKRPEDLLERLQGADRTFRSSVEGDFDGDGLADVALISEAGERLDVWLTPSETALAAAEESDDALIRSLLFDGEDPVWDLDRVLVWLGELGERRTARLTGDRGADASIPLGQGIDLPLAGALAGDVDGDGRDEVLCVYRGGGPGLALAVLRLEDDG